MRMTKERAFVLCAPASMILSLVGLILARWVAPPRPTETATQIAHMYRAHPDAIRVGILLLAFGTALLGPFMAMISVQLRRIDRRSPASSYCQMTLGGLLILEAIVPLMLLATAAFRPDRPATEILLLNDVGWLMLVGLVFTAVVELAVIGVAILQADVQGVFPRWAGWLNLVCAALFALGALSICFTTGVFAWNGLLAYWVPLFAFGAWVGAMTMILLKAVGEEEREESIDTAGLSV